MKVMVLGGRGFVGRRVVSQLQDQGDVEVVVASRSAGAGGIAVDSRNEADMTRALQGVNVVVNCVTGDSAAISEGARAGERCSEVRTASNRAPEHHVSLWQPGRLDHGRRASGR